MAVTPQFATTYIYTLYTLLRNQTNEIAQLMLNLSNDHQMFHYALNEGKYHAAMRKQVIAHSPDRENLTPKTHKEDTIEKVQFKSFPEMNKYFNGFEIYNRCPDFYFLARELFYDLKGEKELNKKRDALCTFEDTLKKTLKALAEAFFSSNMTESDLAKLMTQKGKKMYLSPLPQSVDTLEKVLSFR